MNVGVVAVLDLAGEVSLDIVGVHSGAGYGVRRGVTDGKAILDDVFAGLDGRNRHLVTLGDVLHCGDGGVFHRHGGTLGDGMQRHDHVVGGVNFDGNGLYQYAFAVSVGFFVGKVKPVIHKGTQEVALAELQGPFRGADFLI